MTLQSRDQRLEFVVQEGGAPVDGGVFAGQVAAFEVGQVAAEQGHADGDVRGVPVVVTLHALVERGDWDHQEMVQVTLGPLADARLTAEALLDVLVEMAGKVPGLRLALRKAGFHDSIPTSQTAPIDRGAIAVTPSVPVGG